MLEQAGTKADNLSNDSVGSSVKSCPYTTIHLVDELGEPFANAKIKIEVSDGTVLNETLDDNGKVKVLIKKRATFELFVSEVHEIAEGNAIKTNSGQHLAMV